jgi:hypothetical protein
MSEITQHKLRSRTTLPASYGLYWQSSSRFNQATSVESDRKFGLRNLAQMALFVPRLLRNGDFLRITGHLACAGGSRSTTPLSTNDE